MAGGDAYLTVVYLTLGPRERATVLLMASWPQHIGPEARPEAVTLLPS